MIFLPVASSVVSPIWALTIMVVMDVIGPLPNVPRALRDGHPGDVLRLALGMLVALPAGVLLLSMMAPDAYRYAVSIISLVLLAALIMGLRYRGDLSKAVPYLLANMVGAAIFKPEYETGYRIAAYIIIGASAITGLPLWADMGLSI